MPSIRDEFGRILDLRWSLARDQCASQPICALRVGPNRGKTPKSCSFKNEGIPEDAAALPPAHLPAIRSAADALSWYPTSHILALLRPPPSLGFALGASRLGGR